MTRRYALRDDQWERIEGLLLGRRHRGRDRQRQSAVCRGGSLSVPRRYSMAGFTRDLVWKAVHTRFSRWAEKGIYWKVFKHLATEADNEYAMIDSTIVRAHQHSAGAKKEGEDQAIGRSKGGLSTKINATVDALGNPTSFCLTPGQACDLDGSDVLLPPLEAKTILADKGYDAEYRVLSPLREAGRKRHSAEEKPQGTTGI